MHSLLWSFGITRDFRIFYADPSSITREFMIRIKMASLQVGRVLIKISLIKGSYIEVTSLLQSPLRRLK